MANPRNSSLTNIAEENLFLDILNDAPLAAHRKPTKIYGSIFYCFLLAGYATVGIAAPWIFQALQPWISQLLCSCNVILLIITGEFEINGQLFQQIRVRN
ncbi:hypothetical protein RND81_12G001200 [Saponaria officinalis]|uniref:Uncharacterized protein n=1 Tax=Saponaria officinalis TaxID=3572 RepID=A0AAW1H1G2_SAPOF